MNVKLNLIIMIQHQNQVFETLSVSQMVTIVSARLIRYHWDTVVDHQDDIQQCAHERDIIYGDT